MSSEAQRLGEALKLAREYVERASQRMYDGTYGEGMRAEARRRLALIDAALAHRADGGTAGHNDVTISIDEYDRLECCRRLLEIIAVGDSADPVADAKQELVSHGFWNDDATPPTAPQDGAPAAEVVELAGWQIERTERRIIVQHPSVGAYAGSPDDAENVASVILYHLAETLLASQGAEGRQPLSEERIEELWNDPDVVAAGRRIGGAFGHHIAYARALLSESTKGKQHG